MLAVKCLSLVVRKVTIRKRKEKKNETKTKCFKTGSFSNLLSELNDFTK